MQNFVSFRYKFYFPSSSKEFNTISFPLFIIYISTGTLSLPITLSPSTVRHFYIHVFILFVRSVYNVSSAVGYFLNYYLRRRNFYFKFRLRRPLIIFWYSSRNVATNSYFPLFVAVTLNIKALSFIDVPS